ncbi:hypothetical protein FB192DRAFT_1286589, partial [Mucor lusitanicus]
DIIGMLTFVLSGNRIAHYPRQHQVCQKANVAICGFWGKQSIPAAPRIKPSTTPAPATTNKPTTSPVRNTPLPPPPPPPPAYTVTTSLEEILPEIQTISDLAPIIDEKLPSEGVPPNTDVLHRFNVNGRNYHVVNKDGNSLAQANMSCRKSQTNIGGVTSAGYQQVAQNLQHVVDTTGNKLIIGSWNGDSYSLRGNNCLIMQLNNGIYPGSCAEATAVLCQS